MKDSYSFIRGSEASKNLTDIWMDAFDDIIPQWLGTTLPAYNACKKRGVAFFEVSNIIDTWSNPERFQEDGYSYLLWNEPNGGCHMSYDADGTAWGAFDWLELLNLRYPYLYDHITPEYMKVSAELSDFRYYHPYFTRYMNCKAPYNYVADRVRDYYRMLTNDPDVNFSIGSRSYFSLNEEGDRYVKMYRSRYYG